MNEGPDSNATDTPTTLFDGIDMDAEYAVGNLSVAPGQPEVADAVETSPEATEPEVTEETPAAEPSETEETPETTEQTVNFDGFDDDDKTLFEGLLEAGHITPEKVESLRLKTMFQSRFTKKTTALAREREAWETEVGAMKEDISLIEQIRGDPKLYDAWLKASKGELTTDDDDADELTDRRSAAEIARAEYERLDAEKLAVKNQEQRTQAEKQQAVQAVLQEVKETTGVDDKTLVKYLNIEEARLPAGTDPIASIAPEEWERRLMDRHEIETVKAKAAALEAQLSKKTSKAASAAKQSLPPAASITRSSKMSIYEQTCADLGVDPVNPNVTGLGHLQR